MQNTFLPNLQRHRLVAPNDAYLCKQKSCGLECVEQRWEVGLVACARNEQTTLPVAD